MARIDGGALRVLEGKIERPIEKAAICPPSRNSVRESPVAIEGLEPALERAMLAAIPQLGAFALSLSRNPDRADDLVQVTLLRACTHIGQFEPGTNLVAWLIRILRNEFLAEQRKRRREVEDGDGAYAETLVVQANQVGRAEYRELYDALAALPHEMREAFVLVGAWGFSYAEAARACACAEGTIKSRVNRARTRLAAMLSLQAPADLLDDPIFRSVAVQAEQDRSRHVG